MISGHLSKMVTSLENDQVQYQLVLDDRSLDLNSLIGQSIQMRYQGAIHCCHCGRKTNKSFSQGYLLSLF